jgi:hypothetical protein
LPLFSAEQRACAFVETADVKALFRIAARKVRLSLQPGVALFRLQ